MEKKKNKQTHTHNVISQWLFPILTSALSGCCMIHWFSERASENS